MIVAIKPNRFVQFICGAMCFILFHLPLKAQESSIPISVFTLQDISFGAFFLGSTGGSVTVLPDGTRLVSGDIILANMGFSCFPAIFEVETDSGTLISILKGSDTVLSGSNGGTINLQIGDSDTGSPIIVPSSGSIQVRMGGILTVGNSSANPSGAYSGSFEITFIQE